MILYPNILLERVDKITIDFLKKNNLKALILDVDNTLIDYYQNLSEEIIDWSKQMRKNGIKLYILSNTNKKQKVEKVSKKMGDLPYKMFAKKPSKKGFLKIQEELNLKPEEIAVVGDQIFTDVIGGNRSKMYTILVEPIDKKDIIITAIKRPIEEIIKNKYKKKVNKGEKDVF